MQVFQTSINVREGQSGVIVMTLRDEAGDLVQTAALDGIFLDLYHYAASEATVINGRDQQDVLNENGGEFFDTLQTMQDQDGNDVPFNFRFTYTPDDTKFLGSDAAAHQKEEHIAHFRFTWDNGDKAIGHEVKMNVTNFRRFDPSAT